MTQFNANGSNVGLTGLTQGVTTNVQIGTDGVQAQSNKGVLGSTGL
jgi:hypothetical protein